MDGATRRFWQRKVFVIVYQICCPAEAKRFDPAIGKITVQFLIEFINLTFASGARQKEKTSRKIVSPNRSVNRFAND